MSRRAFLLTWNPEFTSWDNLDEDIQELQETGKLKGQWSCGVRIHLPIDSRVFLMRVGKVRRGEPPKGIIASGFTRSTPYRRPHWNREKARRGETALYVNIQFDMLAKSPIIPLQTLVRPPFAGFPWTPKSSGIEIRQPFAAELEAIWPQRVPVNLPPEDVDPSSGQGRVMSSEVRQAIEARAVACAREYFETAGYDVEPVGKPHDLHCTKRRETLYVEVKGTERRGTTVTLTKNEVDFARRKCDCMALFILHSVDVIYQDDRPLASGGEGLLLQPWNIDRGKLVVTEYSYTPPGD